MRFLMLLAGAATVAALPAAAQDTNDHPATPTCPAPMRHTARTFSFRTDEDNRAAIGIATTSGSLRDTLGLLVTDVTSGGPAEKAGIEEGDRLTAVNGTELRISAADAGDQEMHGLMTRRLIRVLAKLKPGDVATVRVSSEGKLHEVKITTVKASELYKDEGLMHLGDWNVGAGKAQLAQLAHLGETVKAATASALDHVQEQLESASSGLHGLRIDVPDVDTDVQIVVPDPSDPSPLDAPEPPAPPTISRRFMRISAPTPPAPPAAPTAPAPPSSERVSI